MVGQTIQLLDRLRLFPTAWIRHVLLRYCLDGCKVVHLLRSTGGQKAPTAIQQLSDALRTAAGDLVGGDVPDIAYAQMTLPAAKGGAGIKDPLLELPAARIAALSGFELRGRSLVGALAVVFCRPSADLPSVLQTLSGVLGPQFDPLPSWVPEPSRIAHADSTHATQKWWASAIHEARYSAMERSASLRDRCRLACQKGPLATGWLKAIPSRGSRMEMRDGDYISCLRFWLGLPLMVLPNGAFAKCPACGDPADVFGDHFLCCRMNGLAERHNALRDEILDVCNKSGIPARAEQGCFEDTRDANLLLVGGARAAAPRWTSPSFTRLGPPIGRCA